MEVAAYPTTVPTRVIIRTLGMPLNLAASRCERWLDSNGALTEIVEFEGSGE